MNDDDDFELDNLYSAILCNYTSRALYKDCTKDIPKTYVFSCRLNLSKVGISLMLMDCMAHSMPILRETGTSRANTSIFYVTLVLGHILGEPGLVCMEEE